MTIYLLERGSSGAAKFHTKFRTLLVETELTEAELANTRIHDDHKSVAILDERISHVHYSKMEQERYNAVAKMLGKHADRDVRLQGNGQWCANAYALYGNESSVAQAETHGLDVGDVIKAAARNGDLSPVRSRLGEFPDAVDEAFKRAIQNGHEECASIIQQAHLQQVANTVAPDLAPRRQRSM